MIRRLLSLGVAAAMIAPPAMAVPADYGPADGWAQERSRLEAQRRVPTTAALLSAVPGLGAAYQGDQAKAVIEAGGALGVILASYLLSTGVATLTGSKEVSVVLAIAPIAGYWGWAVTDSYYSTLLANERIDRKLDSLTPVSYRAQVASF